MTLQNVADQIQDETNTEVKCLQCNEKARDDLDKEFISEYGFCTVCDSMQLDVYYDGVSFEDEY